MPELMRANCLIIGNETVGKTCITQVFQSDNCQFQKNYCMTTSLEISSKIIRLPDLHASIEIFLMCTSGKDLFYELNTKQLSHPDMVLIVYDVTNEESFRTIDGWLEKVSSLKTSKDFLVILVGNKIDMEDQRVISAEIGEHAAKSKGLNHMECSAKNMQNVSEIFQNLARQFYSEQPTSLV